MTWLIVSRLGPGVEELRALGPDTWRLKPVPLTASVLALLGGYFMSAAIWGRIVTDLGGPSLPPRITVPLFMVANLGRYLPGKLWQIAGLAALARRHGISVATATAAAVIAHGTGLLAATALGAVALLGSPDPYPRWGTFALVGLAAGLVVAMVPSVYGRVLGAWFRLARAEEPGGLAPRQGIRWLLLALGSWLIYALAFGLMVSGLGLSVAPWVAGSAFAAAYVLGYLMIFAPAGLGPREGFLILFLTPHVGGGAAGLAAVAARVWTTGVEVVPAGLFWLTGAGGIRGRGEHDA